MNDDNNYEEELWDLKGKDHPKITHRGCGGRVIHIADTEFRCCECGEVVAEDDWVVPDEPLLNKVR